MAGIEEIFSQIYRSYHGRVFLFALKRTGDERYAEDLVQTVFLKIWERQETLRSGRVTEALIFTIARNLIIDRYRKGVLHSTHLADLQIPVESDARPVDTSDERMAVLNKAINALPTRRREAFLLSRYHGLTYREIADEMSISPKTVESQISMALKTLRKQLAHLFVFFL